MAFDFSALIDAGLAARTGQLGGRIEERKRKQEEEKQRGQARRDAMRIFLEQQRVGEEKKRTGILQQKEDRVAQESMDEASFWLEQLEESNPELAQTIRESGMDNVGQTRAAQSFIDQAQREQQQGEREQAAFEDDVNREAIRLERDEGVSPREAHDQAERNVRLRSGDIAPEDMRPNEFLTEADKFNLEGVAQTIMSAVEVREAGGQGTRLIDEMQARGYAPNPDTGQMEPGEDTTTKERMEIEWLQNRVGEIKAEREADQQIIGEGEVGAGPTPEEQQAMTLRAQRMAGG